MQYTAYNAFICLDFQSPVVKNSHILLLKESHFGAVVWFVLIPEALISLHHCGLVIRLKHLRSGLKLQLRVGLRTVHARVVHI